MKSNITIASNIYVRVKDDIQHDIEYVHQITGRNMIIEVYNRYCSFTLSSLHLTHWQIRIKEAGCSCSYARDGQASHGLVRTNNRIDYEGRCEYSLCPDPNCAGRAKFTRVIAAPIETIEERSPVLSYEWLEIENIEEVFTEKEIVDEEPVETVPEESIIEDFKEFVRPEEFTKIAEPSAIIEAPINNRILVNAAPGSGKTYMVIKRIEHIISNELVNDFSSVLVLAYTNAAKNEILNRLKIGMSNGTLPYLARNIDICTLDSLATSYLSTIEAQFAHLDYNGRIHLFNEKFDKEDFSNFKYVIVDELQDLVNERALMTLNILSALTGGYLLLGDKCQAIYDYDCRDGASVNSVEFYKRLDLLHPEDVIKYELTGNQRQIISLARLSDDMRCALLEFDDPSDVNSLIENELGNIHNAGKIESIDFSHIVKKTAILCRNNGEAEYISHLLHKNSVQHILLRSVGQISSLNRWIADCFWDYKADSRISEAVFVTRYCGRVADDKDKATRCYEALSELIYGDKKPFIEIEKLSAALCKPTTKMPALLLNSDESLLTVSTIHKAKGREFDCVYLLDSGFSPNATDTEEARVWYVGCTRAKKELNKLKKKKQYLRKSGTNQVRWAGLGFHKARWGNNHCSNLVVGLPKDVFSAGFVAGDLDKAIETQEYIAESISVGDELQLVLTGSVYHVQHKGRVIGSLDSSLYNEFWGIAKANVRTSNPPPFLSPVFVTNIITVTPDKFPDNVSTYFRATKFWLGIELSGFPKIDWNYEEPQPIVRSDRVPNLYSDWDTIK